MVKENKSHHTGGGGMAVETAGKDPRFAVNDEVQMTIQDPAGNPIVYKGQVTAIAYGTAQQIRLLWKGALARNAGELGSRFFYKVRGRGFQPSRAYREETLQVPGEI
jgi:hypothetical protein